MSDKCRALRAKSDEVFGQTDGAETALRVFPQPVKRGAWSARRRRGAAFGSAICVLALATATCGIAGSAALPDYPAVRTLAGSGAVGMADGSATRASFLGPQGIAYDARGNLYVADTPAQRIRRVDPLGNVTTVAGSGAPILFGAGVAGGYRNGPALKAQFDAPTGVAVGANGVIYIADVRNRCIRELRGGVVSTLAGSPARAGDVDGPGSRAAFSAPRSIAIDASGTLWIADPPNGIRRIAPDGTVSTLHDPAFALARSVGVEGGSLYVATPNVVWQYAIAQGKVGSGVATDFSVRYPALAAPVEMKLIGPAAAIAAIAPGTFVYTDPLFSAVTFVSFRKARTFGAPPRLDAATRGGAYRDGIAARFAQPLGIAVAPNGAIAVADTANRRIRLIPPFDARAYESDVHVPDAPNPKVFRIAIVGDSYVWDGVSERQSLGGVVRARLCAHLLPRPCNVEVIPVRFDGGAFTDTASDVAQMFADGLVNEVVIFATSLSFAPPTGDPARRADAMAPVLAKLRAQTNASKTRLVVALFPDAFDLPDATTFGKLVNGPNYDPGVSLQTYRTSLAQVRDAGVDAIDLWPAFFANDASDPYRRLFGAFDDHFTVYGNTVVGEAIARDAIQHGFEAP